MVDGVSLGDVIQTRKPHACGFDQWTVIRTGADIKIKCTHCARIVMMSRDEYFKCAKKRISQLPKEAPDGHTDAPEET